MGEGKTEAAMLLADCWAARLGQQGCYFALPTQATSNQMFDRVRSFLARRYRSDFVNLQLLHGHAALSAEFQLMRQQGDKLLTLGEVYGEDEDQASVAAAEWFTHRKRGLLAPFGVGTIDQALLAVLQTKHVFVRLFGLAHKTVIIDEVHAYDTYMSTLLERLLEWLAALGSSVVLLSATLPEAKRDALLNAYASGAGDEPSFGLSERVQYPRMSCVFPGRPIRTQHVPASPAGRKALRLEWTDRDPQALGAALRDALEAGGCAAVVCNTVARAQKLYTALKEFFPRLDAVDGQPELDLLHSRYMYGDREEREKRCLVRFGKPKTTVGDPQVERPRRAVLVSTQIIEQSLDLDFDLMVTDLAPVDLMLQRSGRLHRHEGRDRSAGLREPVLWVCEPTEAADGVPVFGHEGVDEYVYDAHVLLRSWFAIRDRESVRIPEDVSGLIEQVYGARPCPRELPASLAEVWRDSLQAQADARRSHQAKAMKLVIRSPTYADEMMEDFSRRLAEDSPALHEDLQALTRLCGPSLQVVCLFGSPESASMALEGQGSVPLHMAPDCELLPQILRRSLTISHRSLVARLLADGLQPEGWRRCPLLRHSRALFFGPSGVAEVGSFRIHLDSELGLLVNNTTEEVT